MPWVYFEILLIWISVMSKVEYQIINVFQQAGNKPAVEVQNRVKYISQFK